MPDGAAKSWDRRDDEGAESFAAFCTFRDLGPKRSVRRAHESVAPNTATIARWQFWANHYDWRIRATEYDAAQYEAWLARLAERGDADAARYEECRRNLTDWDIYASNLAYKKAKQILEAPLVTQSRSEKQDGGRTIVNIQPVYQNPALIVAAATLLKAASDTGRRALGMDRDDDDTMSADKFRKLLFKTTEQLAGRMPRGALPPPPTAPTPDNLKPDLRRLENRDMPGGGGGVTAVNKFRPTRERPGGAWNG